jgi:hypothetical protein
LRSGPARRRYAVTFAKGAMPPVQGFWSLTLYDASHFFVPNAVDRYSLGTKNKDLQIDRDGSLTIDVQADPPADRRAERIGCRRRRTAISRSSCAPIGVHPQCSTARGRRPQSSDAHSRADVARLSRREPASLRLHSTASTSGSFQLLLNSSGVGP